MKKYLATASILLLFLTGAIGQTVYTKSRIQGLRKPLNLENMQGISGIDRKFKLLNRNLPKSPTENQFKSASEGNQKLNGLITEYWDATIELMRGLKILYTYDDNGNKSTEIGYQGIDSTGSGQQWTTSYKSEFFYNTSGQDTLVINYFWDNTTREWVNHSKEGYTYDANGNFISNITYSSSNQIEYGVKYENTYDDSGHLIISSVYYWDATSHHFVNSGIYEYTYDANWNVTAKIFSYWDESTSQWIPSYKDEYFYDANGNRTLETGSDWYSPTSEWLIHQKRGFTFDSNGNMTSDSSYWDEINGGNYWSKSEHTYDDDGNLTFSVNYRWNETTSQWDTYSQDTYYYSELVPTPVSGISEEKIRVYPNPASEYVVFALPDISESATVELFDIQGKKVLEQKLSENRQISVHNLRKGLYLFKLSDSGNIYQGKITIE